MVRLRSKGWRLCLLWGTGEFQAIASSIHRFNVFGMAGIWFQFGAEVTHMNPDGFNVIIRIVSPDLCENLARGDGLTVTL
jgi:hypothetical protein